MIDYTQPPIAYLVRVPQQDELSLLYGTALARADDVARFLSYEEIGPVVCSAAIAAVETAEAIFSMCCARAQRGASPEVDEILHETIGAYLRHREPGPPAVLVCDEKALRAGLAVANVCDGEEELVAPGGIVSIHRDPRSAAEGGCGPNSLVAIARHMILNWKFSDLVAMVADESMARSPQPAVPHD